MTSKPYKGSRGGRGRSGGRGGRGFGRSSFNKKTTKKASREYKFAPYTVGSSYNYYTYDTVKKKIISEISLTFGKYAKDIITSIEDGKLIDLQKYKPVRQLAKDPSVKDSDTDKEAKFAIYRNEQTGYDIDYKSEKDIYEQRVQTLQQNKRRAYDLIIKYSTSAMVARIEETKDFETTVKGEPLVVLKKIMELVHDPMRGRYQYASLTEALKRLINIRQQREEDLLDYIKRFKQARDIVKTNVGKDILHNFVEHTDKYKTLKGDKTKQDELKASSFYEWTTYVFMENSDHNKYGSLLTKLHQDEALGKSNWPKDLEAAKDAMAQHKWDIKEEEK